jgi:kynurenine formamidase
MPDEYNELAAKVRNWGRWGSDDQLGTLNFLNDDARRRAALTVKTGKAFSLAIPLNERGPQMGFIKGRINPVHTMVQVNSSMMGGPPVQGQCWNDDLIVMGCQAGTHWDGLAHASLDGVLYNGYPSLENVTAEGATKLGIQNVKTLVGRGVLLDVAKVHGVDRLPGGYAMTAVDLDAACELGHIMVAPGDIVLLHTGHMQHFLEGDKMTYATKASGPSLQTVEWFHRHQVAAVAIDNLIFEVFPCERPDLFLPVHFLHLVEMGLTQGQNWNMEALAADCADDGRYTFLLSASPEPIDGGTGAPVNPVVLK